MDPHNPIRSQIDALVAASQRVGYIRASVHWAVACLLVAAVLIITGCGHISEMTQPPADWPTLKIVDHGADGVLENCSKYTNVLTWPPLGCAVVYFDTMTCHIWHFFGWVREEEVKHCNGRDHEGETTLADAWAMFKGRK